MASSLKQQNENLQTLKHDQESINDDVLVLRQQLVHLRTRLSAFQTQIGRYKPSSAAATPDKPPLGSSPAFHTPIRSPPPDHGSDDQQSPTTPEGTLSIAGGASPLTPAQLDDMNRCFTETCDSVGRLSSALVQLDHQIEEQQRCFLPTLEKWENAVQEVEAARTRRAEYMETAWWHGPAHRLHHAFLTLKRYYQHPQENAAFTIPLTTSFLLLLYIFYRVFRIWRERRLAALSPPPAPPSIMPLARTVRARWRHVLRRV